VHLFGLTGGIASGKSAVAARLRARGVPVIDADVLARDAVAKGTPGLAEVVRVFGGGVLAADGTLDRKKLAAEVFGDEAKRRALNGIVHPIVTMLTMSRASELAAAGHPLACYEAALIVENGVAESFRPLVVVSAPEELQVARACARDAAAEDDVRARIRAQMPLADKVQAADFVIENTGTLADLVRRTDEVLAAICARVGIDEATFAAPESQSGMASSAPRMSRYRTGVSSSYNDAEPRDSTPSHKERAGLVLLYAANFEQLSPAYVFVSPELTIGRDPSNLISVPEQAVSRQHARIYSRDTRWFLQDLGSRNGTMVDGSYVSHEVELEPNHEIRVGDAMFKFVDVGAERYVSYRIDGKVAGDRRAKLFTELVGGAQMDQIAAEIERIAPTELSAVILGETGTGKEVVARGIHRLSGRRGSHQAINCAAIPHNLLESELFGYRRGAFSGADRDKPGLIKLADGGTLFLDEIGDMPLDAQAKLLRVLQSREVFPLGATTPERVDIRVVCATHRDLYQYVKEGKFRGDLLARLNEHVVRLPPLRERKEDIYLLARSFGERYGRPGLNFSFSFLVALLHYDWPFNVRELESCIKRGIALTDGRELDTMHLPDAIAEHMKGYGDRHRVSMPSAFPPPPYAAAGMNPGPANPAYAGPSAGGAPYAPGGGNPGGFGHASNADASGGNPAVGAAAPARRGAPTEDELRALLERHRGNVAAVGRELGKERMQVHRWLKRYNIDLSHYRSE